MECRLRRFGEWLQRLDIAARLTWFLVGISSVWRGVSYLWSDAFWPRGQPPVFEFATQTIPLWVYSVVWITAGVIALASIWFKRIRWLAASVNCGMYIVWALSSYGAWLFLDLSQAWISGLNYSVLGALIAREGGRSGDG